MLDLKFLRENADVVRKAAADRGLEVPLDELLERDGRRRAILQELEEKRAKHKKGNKEIGRLKRDGADDPALREEMGALSEEIKGLEQELKGVEEGIQDILIWVPNVPDA